MSITFNEVVTLEKIECGSCGGVFALTQSFIECKKRDSGGFTCPYCEKLRGWWTSKADLLEKKLDQKRRELTAARCEALREKDLREKAEKSLRRTNNGVCTCCNRSFTNLRRHMKTKHPEILLKP